LYGWDASWMHHLFYSFLIGVVLYPNNMLVVREEDKDCPLSWENDEGLQQLVEQKRKAPDAWTWFVDNCLKQVNVTTYNNYGYHETFGGIHQVQQGLSHYSVDQWIPLMACPGMSIHACIVLLFSQNYTLVCGLLLVPCCSLVPHCR
jgi:hypothetical protein